MFETRQSGLWWPRWSRDQEMRLQRWIASRYPPGTSHSRMKLRMKLHLSSMISGGPEPQGSTLILLGHQVMHPILLFTSWLQLLWLAFPATAPHTRSDLSHFRLTSSKSCSCSGVFSGSPLPVTTVSLNCRVLYDHPFQKEGPSHLLSPAFLSPPVPLNSTFLPQFIQTRPTPHLPRLS